MYELKRLTKRDKNDFVALRKEMLLSDKDTNYDKFEIENLTKKYYLKYINKSLFVFGIYEDKKLVSIAGLELIKRLPTPKINNLNSDIGYICSVYTKEEYRRKGYALMLLNEIVHFASSKGISRFQLSTHNPKAIKLYEKLGFHKNETMMSK